MCGLRTSLAPRSCVRFSQWPPVDWQAWTKREGRPLGRLKKRDRVVSWQQARKENGRLKGETSKAWRKRL
eukprot:990030-Lingulodinium_polyedra.AAC.1